VARIAAPREQADRNRTTGAQEAGVMRPLIGIVAQSHGREEPGMRTNAAYVYAIEDAGGLPVIVPLLRDEDALRQLYRRLDGLLLTGGPDVHPRYYGEEVRPTCGRIDEPLDRVELTLLCWALDDDLPFFGICRGMQLLNVACGGTLYQDLPTEYSGALDHRPPDGRTALVHELRVEPGTRLAELLGTTHLRVNSTHHQAARVVAAGLVVSARAEDGVIEGLEHPGKTFALGVQCHPEELYHAHPPLARLFSAFVAAAGRRMALAAGVL
jgi:putative glutamine amidotransferase